jgi:hypothetical protein
MLGLVRTFTVLLAAALAAEFDDLTHSNVTSGQCRQRVAEPDEVGGCFGTDVLSVFERDQHDVTATFLTVATPRELDENAPHHLRRHREKVCAILPSDAIDIDQAQIDAALHAGGESGIGAQSSERGRHP